MKAVKGQIAPDRPTPPTSTKLVPPEGFARLAQQPIEILIAA